MKLDDDPFLARIYNRCWMLKTASIESINEIYGPLHYASIVRGARRPKNRMFRLIEGYGECLRGGATVSFFRCRTARWLWEPARDAFCRRLTTLQRAFGDPGEPPKVKVSNSGVGEASVEATAPHPPWRWPGFLAAGQNPQTRRRLLSLSMLMLIMEYPAHETRRRPVPGQDL